VEPGGVEPPSDLGVQPKLSSSLCPIPGWWPVGRTCLHHPVSPGCPPVSPGRPSRGALREGGSECRDVGHEALDPGLHRSEHVGDRIWVCPPGRCGRAATRCTSTAVIRAIETMRPRVDCSAENPRAGRAVPPGSGAQELQLPHSPLCLGLHPSRSPLGERKPDCLPDARGVCGSYPLARLACDPLGSVQVAACSCVSSRQRSVTDFTAPCLGEDSRRALGRLPDGTSAEPPRRSGAESHDCHMPRQRIVFLGSEDERPGRGTDRVGSANAGPRISHTASSLNRIRYPNPCAWAVTRPRGCCTRVLDPPCVRRIFCDPRL